MDLSVLVYPLVDITHDVYIFLKKILALPQYAPIRHTQIWANFTDQLYAKPQRSFISKVIAKPLGRDN